MNNSHGKIKMAGQTVRAWADMADTACHLSTKHDGGGVHGHMLAASQTMIYVLQLLRLRK